MLVEAEQAAYPRQGSGVKTAGHKILREAIFAFALSESEEILRQEILVKSHVVVQQLKRGDAAHRHLVGDVERGCKAVGDEEAAVEARVVVCNLPRSYRAVRIAALIEVADEEGVGESEIRRCHPVGFESACILAFAAGLLAVVSVGEEAVGA